MVQCVHTHPSPVSRKHSSTQLLILYKVHLSLYDCLLESFLASTVVCLCLEVISARRHRISSFNFRVEKTSPPIGYSDPGRGLLSRALRPERHSATQSGRSTRSTFTGHGPKTRDITDTTEKWSDRPIPRSPMPLREPHAVGKSLFGGLNRSQPTDRSIPLHDLAEHGPVRGLQHGRGPVCRGPWKSDKCFLRVKVDESTRMDCRTERMTDNLRTMEHEANV